MKSVPSAVKLAAFILLSTLLPAHAAVRETWVQHFDGGFPNKASQPVAMQLDSQGNIYVVGSAANASNLTDYVTLKYAPSGTLLWSKRYGTTNGLNNVPRAIGFDTNDNLYITGTSVTAKYSSSGDELWTAPYAGRSLVVNGTNLYVTGFSETRFATAALTREGQTEWTRIYDEGPGWPSFYTDISISVLIDDRQRILVIGRQTVSADRIGNYTDPVMLTYDKQGAQLAMTRLAAARSYPGYGLNSVVQASSGQLYLLGDITYIKSDEFQCLARTSNGATIWDFFGNPTFSGGAITSAVESGNYVYAVGDVGGYGLVQIKSDGTPGWVGYFPGFLHSGTYSPRLYGVAKGISLCSQHQLCLTGYVYEDNALPKANIGTAQYATNGTVLWAEQYNGTANGYDEGKAIVTDSSGNVYVAGLSTTPEGGTEIVLIKYSESANVEQSPTGTILLQFPGTPGQPYKIQASTNLPNWLDIGLGTATTNGLLQFEDTNATQHPFRFYQTVTPSP